MVFRTGEAVKHPVTGKPAGYLTEFVGTLKVVALGDNFVKAQIVDTWDAVMRGDLVGPFGERLVERWFPGATRRRSRATSSPRSCRT